MPRTRQKRWRRAPSAGAAWAASRAAWLVPAALMVALMLLAGFVWFRPYLERRDVPVAEVPTPPALFEVAEFAVPPRKETCMSGITVTPASSLAAFVLRPAKAGTLGPPVDLVLSASGYRSVTHVPGGYPGGAVQLPMQPPKRSLVAQACFINRGHAAVLLNGTTEARTVAPRAVTVADGRSVYGDIALTFLQSRPRAPIERLGEIFEHASNLTDRLLPTWLVWVLAIATALAVPAAIVLAFTLALRADERSREPSAL